MSEVNLKRRNFFEWKSSVLETAQGDDKFTDVTLVAKDGQSVSAHRIILSYASPFFASLLSLQAHPHPVILIPTVEGALLGPLLDFLYLGEVLLPSPESLEGFMQLVTCLGLESGVDLEELENEDSRPIVIEDAADTGAKRIDKEQMKLLEPHDKAKELVNSEETLYEEEKCFGNVNWSNMGEVQSDKKAYVQRSQAPSLKEKNLSCDFCDYRIHRNDLLRVHMNSKHDVEKFKCTVASCSKVYSSKSNLRNHMKSWHSCSQCDHEAESNTDLKLHKRVVHNAGNRYPM